MSFVLSCPVCESKMRADTASGEEFSCVRCHAMVDVIDDDFTMISLPPHRDVSYMPTAELRWFPAVLAR